MMSEDANDLLSLTTTGEATTTPVGEQNMGEDGDVSGRVSKREFVKRLARRSGVSVRVATAVYDATIEEIFETVADNKRLTLTGFGKFFVQTHKGHRVTRIDESSGTASDLGRIEDYSVLKFSATRAVNKDVGARVKERTDPNARKRSSADVSSRDTSQTRSD